MSTLKKDCGNHGLHKLYRRALAYLLALVVTVLFIILVVYLVLRPAKPRFSLQDASVYSFNLSAAPSLLSSTLQVTISSRNPNDRIGIYYDRVDVYAAYKSQQVTVAAPVSPSYQGHNDVAVWSPFLAGNQVPVAPFLAQALAQDQNAGLMLLHIRVDGRVRWKVGSWVSGVYHLYVDCPAFLTFDGKGGAGGKGYWPVMRFQQISTCSVDV